jgi:hypothetical protein
MSAARTQMYFSATNSSMNAWLNVRSKKATENATISIMKYFLKATSPTRLTCSMLQYSCFSIGFYSVRFAAIHGHRPKRMSRCMFFDPKEYPDAKQLR